MVSINTPQKTAKRRRSAVKVPHKPELIEQRNRMVEQYLPLVKTIASDVCAGTSANIEYDDLFSAGVFGLMDSVGSFDQSRGVKFSTYCKRRIRGSMLDELRRQDWVPRWTRQQHNQITKARTTLESKLNRRVNDKELAREMGMEQNEYRRMMKNTSITSMISLDSVAGEDSGSNGLENSLPADKTQDPVEMLQKKDAKEYITRSLSKLEKMIIVLYYYEEMTMSEIGKTLSISESRVSQIHSDIINRLRQRLCQSREKYTNTI